MSIADATSAMVPTYARAKVAFERGEGCWLVSTTGERYLDFGAGIAVTSVGHAHPHLVEALTNQGSKLWHVSNLYQNPEGERYAKRLIEATFADLVFFANSGAEANEAAVKMARRRHSVDGHPERYPHPHLRRRVPWPHAGHDRRRRPGQISRRFRAQGRRLRPDSADRSQGGRGGDRAGDGHDHDRADPGRGRGAGRPAGVPARLARDLRPARPPFDLRRSADRRRPHGAVLRLRALRHSSRHSRPPPRASARAFRCRPASRPRTPLGV